MLRLRHALQHGDSGDGPRDEQRRALVEVLHLGQVARLLHVLARKGGPTGAEKDRQRPQALPVESGGNGGSAGRVQRREVTVRGPGAASAVCGIVHRIQYTGGPEAGPLLLYARGDKLFDDGLQVFGEIAAGHGQRERRRDGLTVNRLDGREEAANVPR